MYTNEDMIHMYTAHSPCFFFPLLIPFSSPFSPSLLTWNPPSCDRIRPPCSQVARKLTSPFPSPGSYTPLPKIPTPQGFPDPNIHSLGRHWELDPQARVHSPFAMSSSFTITLLQLGALDASQSSTIFFSGLYIDEGGRLSFPAASIRPLGVVSPEVLHA
jgi:hypothetical protein